VISADQALLTILELVRPLEPIETGLEDALDRVLAEDVRADVDLPPMVHSSVDGYAVRALDTAEAERAPCQLLVLERVAAGSVPSRALEPGTAAKVMTGAPVPAGADAMVMIEQVEEHGDRITIRRPARAGDHLRPIGEDLRAGAIAIHRGHPLRPPELGLLAAVGRTRVRVLPAPRVAVLATGDELIEPDAPLLPGKVRNSNLPMLAALVRSSGAIPIALGVARDQPEALRQRLQAALGTAEVLLTTGGVSKGDFDLVQHLLPEVGFGVRFHGVRIKPGKPIFFGARGSQLAFGLPGNPVSALVGFEVFVRPALRRLMGIEPAAPPAARATLEVALRKSDDKRHYVRVTLRREAGRLWARPTGPQGSHLISSAARADGLLILAEAERELAAGASAEVIVLPYAPLSRCS
jgi:molybdopterin molybdotransferase